MDLIKDSHICFINLDHRTDRLNHMGKELAKVSLNANRFRGIPWKETDYLNAKYARMYSRTPGAIGCHLSQVSVMEQALNRGKHAWVMEDDIIFCSDFNSRIEMMGNMMEGREWDVLWLGASFHVPAFWHKIGQSGMPPNCSAQLGYDVLPTDEPRLLRTFGAYITFAYIVNVKSIDKILKLFDEHVHTSIGIDWLFIKLQPQLNCFSFVPGSVMQMDNQSDIGNGMTIWSGQLNNGPYVFKDKMEDFNPTTYSWK